MKNLRRLFVALVFTLAVTVPAVAGEIDTTITSPPPQSAQAATTGGDIETTIAGQAGTGSSEATSTGSATETAPNLLQSVLSLF
jgi:urease alpha subunit